MGLGAKDGCRRYYNYYARSSLVHSADCIYTSPTAADEDILTPDDAMNVCEEIVEAQNKSFNIGLKLHLDYHIVNGIHSDVRYKEPFDRLLHVVIEASKQIDPGLTWGAIVDALRSPGVNLGHLARKLEIKHCPERASGLHSIYVLEPRSYIYFITHGITLFCRCPYSTSTAIRSSKMRTI